MTVIPTPEKELNAPPDTLEDSIGTTALESAGKYNRELDKIRDMNISSFNLRPGQNSQRQPSWMPARWSRLTNNISKSRRRAQCRSHEQRVSAAVPVAAGSIAPTLARY
jgi:hypothetical protein